MSPSHTSTAITRSRVTKPLSILSLAFCSNYSRESTSFLRRSGHFIRIISGRKHGLPLANTPACYIQKFANFRRSSSPSVVLMNALREMALEVALSVRSEGCGRPCVESPPRLEICASDDDVKKYLEFRTAGGSQLARYVKKIQLYKMKL